MLRSLGYVFGFVFFFSGTDFAQQADSKKEEPHLSIRSDPKFSIRILEIHAVLTEGLTTRTCLIIYPNQSFHFERWQQGINDQKSKTQYLAESTLTASEADQLTAILQDGTIAKLDQAIPDRGSGKDVRLLGVEIPRTNFVIQSFNSIGTDQKEIDPATKPILSLLRSIEKRRPPKSSDATANLCKAPPAKANSPQ
jgi:hypothetical protein